MAEDEAKAGLVGKGKQYPKTKAGGQHEAPRRLGGSSKWINGVNWDLMLGVAGSWNGSYYNTYSLFAVTAYSSFQGIGFDGGPLEDAEAFLDRLVSALGEPWLAVGSLANVVSESGDWTAVAVNLSLVNTVSVGQRGVGFQTLVGGGVSSAGWEPYDSSQDAVAAIHKLMGNTTVT